MPIKDANAKANTFSIAYDRIFDFGGQSGSVAIVVPYAVLSASGDVVGTQRSVTRRGLADVLFRVSANLYGAPALSFDEYRAYRQDAIVGASLYVTAPTGQYDGSKLVNIGTHRWSFKSELGVSKALGSWTFEAAAGATFFTTNDDFFGGHQRKQDPLYSVQAHAIYNFDPKLWIAVDATYYAGGSTTLDGVHDDDRQSNSRYGATLSYAFGPRDSIKAYVSSGATARIGSNFHRPASLGSIGGVQDCDHGRREAANKTKVVFPTSD